MKFECTECGQHLEVETIYSGRGASPQASQAGGQVACPSCGATVTIPTGDEPAMAVDDEDVRSSSLFAVDRSHMAL